MLETCKHKNKELEEHRETLESDILKQIGNIEQVNEQIEETKKKVIEKNQNKKDIEEETKKLREDIGL